MKKSIFKGLSLSNPSSKSIYEKSLNESFIQKNPFQQKINTLAKYSVNDWEQLYSLVTNKTIKENLKESLNLEQDQDIAYLKKLCETVISPSKRKVLDEIDFSMCPLGARVPQKKDKDTKNKFTFKKYNDFDKFTDSYKKHHILESYDKIDSFNYANSINHIHQLNPILSQGNDRGTCTAFAVSAANEFSIFIKTARYYDLSEQYLFHETKILENDSVCGSWIESAMDIISSKGQCLESIWSYNPHPPCVQSYGKPSNADQNARSFTNTYFEISPNNIQALKLALTSIRIIPFSIPIFDSWYYSSDTYRTGRITLPLNNEEATGGHAMVLVGYQDTDHSPGGGYFIIRNSWGTNWAKDSYYGPGYGIIPYKYIEMYNWEAFAF